MTKPAPEDLFGLVARLHRRMTDAFMADLRQAGFDDITPAFAAIMPLIDVVGSRQSDMARKAGATKQAIGQLVKELTARGYVTVARDPSDVRATIVTFTERGRALRSSGFRAKRRLMSRIETRMGRDDLARAGDAVERLAALFKPADRTGLAPPAAEVAPRT